MITYPCGCSNELEPVTGAHFSVTKCDHHKSKQRECGELGPDYYAELGTIVDGKPANSAHRAEFEECFGILPTPPPESSHLAVELGCGASPYVNMIRDSGWQYLGLDSSTWACQWMNTTYGDGTAITTDLDRFGALHFESAEMALCAHALEHVKNPKAVLQTICRLLKPLGVLYLIIPDGDDDPVNPDHLWFFNRASLRKIFANVGLTIEEMQVRQRVPHEKFIYVKARRGPSP